MQEPEANSRQFGRWITYSRSQGFEPTELALEFAPIAETCGHLDSKSPLSNIDSISSNIAYEA